MEKEICTNMCSKNHMEMLCDNDISCFSKIAGTLTGEEIEAHKLVIPEKNSPKDCVQSTTYDLTLGEGHYIYSGHNSDKGKKWNLIFIGTDERKKELNEKNSEAEQYERLDEDKRKTLFIPPFGSAFVQLNETVDTYTVAKEKGLLVVGRFDLKLSNVHQGLISQQATQVEPCYKGKLFCFIHNLSNKAIELKYGQKMATIEFSYVSCFCNHKKRLEIINNLIEKNKKKYGVPFCNGMGIDEVRYFHAEEQLPDDCGLLGFKEKMIEHIKTEEIMDELAKKVEKRVDKKAKWIPVIVAIIAAAVSIFTAIYPNKKHTEDLQKLQKQVETLEENLNKNSTSSENVNK